MRPLQPFINTVDDAAERLLRTDPDYPALVEKQRRREAEEVADVVSRIRRGQFGTNREIADYYHHNAMNWVQLWKREAQRSGKMSEAEWNKHLRATQRKRKAKAARKHDST